MISSKKIFGKTKSLCTIDLTSAKTLIQLNLKHKVHSLRSVLYFYFVHYF